MKGFFSGITETEESVALSVLVVSTMDRVVVYEIYYASTKYAIFVGVLAIGALSNFTGVKTLYALQISKNSLVFHCLSIVIH